MSNKRLKNKIKIRKKISGTAERPRLAVYKSLKQIYTQLIDDSKGVTLLSASSLSKEILNDVKDAKSKIDKSKVVGKLLAEKAKDKGIETVVFDRSGYRYHGRVQAVAEGAREGGLKF
ncbi:MAG: 50S ribosomal protein L18 [Melioribacteraceae bacterium]|nr:50S ribosomal protein L18 [Melioribacteraceae bacterium]